MGVHGNDLFPFDLLMNAFLSSDFWFHYEMVVRYHWHRYRLVFSSLREANWDMKSQGVTAEWNMRFWMSKYDVMCSVNDFLIDMASAPWSTLAFWEKTNICRTVHTSIFGRFWWLILEHSIEKLLVCIHSLDWQDYVRSPKRMCYNN